MNTRRHVAFLLAFALFFTAGAQLSAQGWEGAAAVGVRVTDEDGQPIADAQVVARVSDADDLGPPPVATDAGGRAVVSGLRDGEWFIEVSHPGYMLFAAYVNLRAGKKPVVGFSSQVNTATSWSPMTVKFQKAAADFRRGAPKRAEPKPPTVVRETAPPPPPKPKTVVRPEPEPPKVVRPEPEAEPAASEVPEETATETTVEPVDEPPLEASEPESEEVPVVVDPPAEEVPEAEATKEPIETPGPEPEPQPATEQPAPQPVTPAPAPEIEPQEEPDPEPPTTAPEVEEAAIEAPAEIPEPVELPEAEPAAEAEPRSVETADTAPEVSEEPDTESTSPSEEPVADAAEDVAAAELPPAEPTPEPQPVQQEVVAAPAPVMEDPNAAEVETPEMEIAEPESTAPVETIETEPMASTAEPVEEKPVEEAPTETPASEPAPTAPAERTAEPPPAPEPTAPSSATAVSRIPRFLRSAAAGTCSECQAGEWAVAAEQEAARSGDTPATSACTDEYLATARAGAQALADSPGERLDGYVGPMLTAMFRLDDSSNRDLIQEQLGSVTDPESNCQMAGIVLPRGTSFSGYVLEAWDNLGGRGCRAGMTCAVGRARWLEEPEVVVGSERSVVFSVFKNRSTRRPRRLRMTIYFKPDAEDWAPRTR